MSDITHTTTGDGTKVTDTVWSEEHTVGWPSITEHYMPMAYRMDEKSIIFYDGTYFVLRIHTHTDGYTHYGSITVMGQQFGYGTYEYYAKLAGVSALCDIHVGGFERCHGFAEFGLIAPMYQGSTASYILRTMDNAGNIEDTVIAGADWTSEKKFTIEWTVSSVKLWVDDVLKATNTTRVPTQYHQFYTECVGANNLAVEPICYVKANTLKEV